MLVISNKMMRIISILITVLIIVACLPLSIAYAQNEITVYIDGKKMDFSQPPIVIEDRTLVPMREVFETLGAVIEWDSDTETVTAVRSEKTIILKINETNAYIDGKQQALDVPACLIDNKTMIPLRFVSEALGASVDWSEKSQSIYIFFR